MFDNIISASPDSEGRRIKPGITSSSMMSRQNPRRERTLPALSPYNPAVGWSCFFGSGTDIDIAVLAGTGPSISVLGRAGAWPLRWLPSCLGS